MEIKMKRTALYNRHMASGAVMVPFAGWEMPLQYSDGIIAEHKHTRSSVTLFDICHMSEFRINGDNALEELDTLLARPITDMEVGSCRYNFMLNEDGKVIDDLIVYKMAEDDCMVVSNAGTNRAVGKQLDLNLHADLDLTDLSATLAKLDLQGPLSVNILERCGQKSSELPKYFHWKKMNINGISCIVSRTGYTGELGFEIYFDVRKATVMWDYLLSFPEVRPGGLGCRDTLRLEMGYNLYGHELGLEVTPLDVNGEKLLALDKYPEREFIGKDSLVKSEPQYKLIGIKCESRQSPRAGYSVSMNGQNIGSVTSGAFGPSLNVGIAMARVDYRLSCPIGAEVEIVSSRGAIKGKICDIPFYLSGSVRKNL